MNQNHASHSNQRNSTQATKTLRLNRVTLRELATGEQQNAPCPNGSCFCTGTYM